MIIDILNLPTEPNSDLDSDGATSSIMNIQPDVDGLTQLSVCIGDWIDLDPNLGIKDHDWGYSFQVMGIYPGAVGVLIFDPVTQAYGESQVSLACIKNVFRRVSRV